MNAKIGRFLAIGGVSVLSFHGAIAADRQEPADTVFVGGKIITVNGEDQVAEALAVRGDRVVAVGSGERIRAYRGSATEVIDLDGKTVIPGITEAHVHSMYVARKMFGRPYRDYSSIAELQQVVRWLAGQLDEGEWIVVPRVPITRLSERRHPTTAELDAACANHPVVFTSARKSALNSLALKKLGLDGDEIPKGVEVVRDEEGNIRLLGGISALLRKANPGKALDDEAVVEALAKVHGIYNSVGITSIFERANGREQWDLFKQLRDSGDMTVRATLTFRRGMNSAADVRKFVDDLGLEPRAGDDWLRAGPLKVTADGGIHWGTTFLSEPFGEKRNQFYGLENDPEYRGNLNFTVDEMTEVFGEAHRLGWQMSAHITGDLGITRVLDALDRIDKGGEPVAKMRFQLIHAYFTTPDILERGKRLGVCVDTQSYLYLKDADFIAKVYGEDWAKRFIPLGDWYRAGIPVATNSDHMEGLDPNHAINSFNPFLMLYAAVTRRDEFGNVYGEDQKLTRMEALRTITLNPAFLSFDEKTKGSLEPGKLADLVVLDRDYLECPDSEIRKIKPVLTMVGGKVVFRKK